MLLDTEPLYTEATQAVVGQYGHTFGWSIKGDMMGRSAIEGARHLMSKLDLPISAEEYLAQRKPLLEALFETAPEMPGARNLVENLAERGKPLALATSSSKGQFELKTSHHSWFSAFDVVVCGDDARVGALKPAPDIFLVAAAELRAEPSACLVFEDSLAGVAAAKAAGMQVVATPDPHMDATRYTEADLVIPSLVELDWGILGF